MPDFQAPNKGVCLMIIKIVNVVTALVLIGFGVFGIIYMSLNAILSGKFFLVFSPIFMILFGIMLIAAEFKVKFLFTTFGFLASMIGRGIFNLYLASQVFFYFSCGSGDTVLAWIAASVIFALGILYIGLHFCGGKQYAAEVKPDSTIV